MLSEESAQAPWAERRKWRELWVVDPLDGTREFVKRNGEFTDQYRAGGASTSRCSESSPRRHSRLVYWGAAGIGAFRRRAGERQQPPSTSRRRSMPLRVVGSRSHASPQTAAYLRAARTARHDRGIGSSLKFCLVAEGQGRSVSALRTDLRVGHGRRSGGARGGRRSRDPPRRPPLALQLPRKPDQRRFRRLQPCDALRPRAPQRRRA